jgi:hypothetical protein
MDASRGETKGEDGDAQQQPLYKGLSLAFPRRRVARWTPWSNSEAVMAEIAKSSSTWSATWVSKSSCLRSRAIKTLESITIPMVT